MNWRSSNSSPGVLTSLQSMPVLESQISSPLPHILNRSIQIQLAHSSPLGPDFRKYLKSLQSSLLPAGIRPRKDEICPGSAEIRRQNDGRQNDKNSSQADENVGQEDGGGKHVGGTVNSTNGLLSFCRSPRMSFFNPA